MRRSAVSVLCFLLILAGLAGPAAAKRVALVIGNDSYENVPDLRKAVNDAKAVGAALESIGFEVLRAENVSRREMNSQVQSFASKLEKGDEAVFFFAGHGVEIQGRNFLLPVDMPGARPGQEDFVEAEAVSAARVLETIRRRGARVAILVLDACRDNPFQTEGTRSLGGSRGLARMDASKGTFIIYSADVGQTALDRLSNSDADPNSVFTRSLVPMLKRPGLPLPQMARGVRAEVEKLALGVSHDQRPAYYDGITGEFFFAGEAGEAAPKVQDAPVAAPSPADNAVEVAFWNSVQSSDSAEAIQEYLTRFPYGAFVGLAKIRLKALEQKQAALPPPEEAADMGPNPADLIRGVYAKLSDGDGDNDPDVTENGPNSAARSIYTESMVAVLIKNPKCWEDDRGAYLFAAGNGGPNVEGLSVETVTSAGDTQAVQASFGSFGEQQTWRFEFRRTDSGWRIEDMDQTNDDIGTVREIIGGC